MIFLGKVSLKRKINPRLLVLQKSRTLFPNQFLLTAIFPHRLGNNTEAEKTMRKILIILISFLVQPIFSQSINDWQYKKSSDWKNEANNFQDEDGWSWIQVPQNLAKIASDSESDLYWLRNFFSITDFDPNRPLSMRLGIILDCERIWINQKEIILPYQCDSTKPQAYDKIRIIDLPSNLLNKTEKNEIRILVKRYFPEEIGIVQDRIEIGTSQRIYQDFFTEEAIRLSFLIVYLTVACYFLFLFIRRPQEKEYLYFALFTMNLVLYQFFRSQSKYFLDVEFWILKKCEYLTLPSFIPFMAHFIRCFFRYPYNKKISILDLISLFIFICLIFINEIKILDIWNRFIIQPIWILYLILSLSLLVRETRKGNKNATLILVGIFMIVASAVVDILVARFVWNIPRISGYIFIGNVLFQALILANRFVQINKEVEDLNRNLERKVIERTKSLEYSLNEIQKLKTNQDGDYFLTSLLLKPLHRNCKSKSVIQTEFITHQKKQFEFKNKIHQIGGDLSLTEEIELRGKKFILFINSDSMGKSIQGAGGALVLGVIVESLIARLKNQNFRNKYPERWLKEAFLDIQKAFETFDGSMFVSMIMGLVDTANGFLYYFNAEHPQPILYRNNKASFLKLNDNFYLRKMGIKENISNFYIETFSLEAQDQIFLGTDGKDDIYLFDEVGNKLMNEDESRILKFIEKSNGDLHLLKEYLNENAELADDISILKIKNTKVQQLATPPNIKYINHLQKGKSLAKKGFFHSAKKELAFSLQINPFQLQTSILLGKLEFQLKNYDDAFVIWEKTLSLFPNSIETIYLQALALKKDNRIMESIDTAERIRLRQPNHKQALELLNQLYCYNYQRSSFDSSLVNEEKAA